MRISFKVFLVAFLLPHILLPKDKTTERAFGIESFRTIQMTFLKSKLGCSLCSPRFKEP